MAHRRRARPRPFIQPTWNAINFIDAEPEQRLAAAVLDDALKAAQHGDAREQRWLRSRAALFWVQMLTPEGLSQDTVHQRFLDRLEEAA
jgi:hypothetical protein